MKETTQAYLILGGIFVGGYLAGRIDGRKHYSKICDRLELQNGLKGVVNDMLLGIIKKQDEEFDLLKNSKPE